MNSSLEIVTRAFILDEGPLKTSLKIGPEGPLKTSLKIAFLSPNLCVRGSSVAEYDYANYNEVLLGNKSIIIYPRKNEYRNDPMALRHFSSRFPVFAYDDLEEILEREKCNLLYVIKYGKRDEFISHKIKTVVHCVFDLSEPHGQVYTAVSKNLARRFRVNSFVPHMIGLQPSKTKENLREVLRIPENSVVFGRYGGEDTFNVPFTWEVIQKILLECSNVYFLFINTPSPYSHERLIHLPKITSYDDKNRFIGTCDAGLSFCNYGHTFCLADGEFSVNNKPIILYCGPETINKAHIENLEGKAILFSGKDELYGILKGFKKNVDKDYRAYSEFTPEKVIKIFKRVCID